MKLRSDLPCQRDKRVGMEKGNNINNSNCYGLQGNECVGSEKKKVFLDSPHKKGIINRKATCHCPQRFRTDIDPSPPHRTTSTFFCKTRPWQPPQVVSQLPSKPFLWHLTKARKFMKRLRITRPIAFTAETVKKKANLSSPGLAVPLNES